MNKQINHQPNTRQCWLISRLFFRNVALLGLTTLFVSSAAIAHAKLPSNTVNIARRNIEQFSLARNPSNLKVPISYQIVEKQETSENLRFHSTGLWNDSQTVEIYGGQAVEFYLENRDVLPTAITIHLVSPTTTTDSQSLLLLPLGKGRIRFSIFGAEPILYRFTIKLEADSPQVQYALYSTWIPGDPPNPSPPNQNVEIPRSPTPTPTPNINQPQPIVGVTPNPPINSGGEQANPNVPSSSTSNSPPQPVKLPLPNSEEQLVGMMSQEVSGVTNSQQQSTDSLTFFTAPEILALRAVEVITQQDLMKCNERTWCNRAAERILKRSGVDTKKLGITYWDSELKEDVARSANDIAQKLSERAEQYNSGVRFLTETEAQNSANKGKLVIAAKSNPSDHGHVAIVIPYNGSLQSSTRINKKREKVLDGGPLVAQAGNTNAIFSAYSAFNLKSESEISSIKYYEITPTDKPLPLQSTPQQLLDWLNQKELPPTVNLSSGRFDIRASLIRKVQDWQKTEKPERNAALEAKLEEELKKRNQEGLPPPPPPGANPILLNVNQAQEQGVRVEVTGTGDRSSLRLRVTNPHQDQWLLLDVPRGSTFNPGTLNTQDMMTY